MSIARTASAAASARALSRLQSIAFGFVNAQAFASACELGVFEALSDGPLSVDALAKRIAVQPRVCRRLLMLLASLELVKQDDRGFHNSELGTFCSSKSAVNLSRMSAIAPFYHMSEYLTAALRDNEPQWQRALGASAQETFGALYADPAALRNFAALMNALSVPQGQLVAESYDFSQHACLLDVAGGPGGQSIEIGLRHPHLRGIVTDLEPVCVVAREYIHAAGLDGRFTAVPADLIVGPYPAGADVILLGHILHDWSDETCRKILQNAARALPSGGTLLLSESVLNQDFSANNNTLTKDLLMLIANESDARERSEEEYRTLLHDSGFALATVIRLDAPRDLIVAKRRE
jgi:N,N-dimethyltransferase/O-methyltransferase